MPPRMKSIELQGYKTFANKVFFEFPRPITAIVGPNGSGKSNISDAIRWVLGEQSYSVLRGHRTTDMIFSGSDKKARASMASATITFDNSEHWLPVDYEEVAVTRRAYRDGQNEYLLNGQRVRLKDVNELLAQSGLSERTYTIIGQGLIDSALSARPEDRRRFFEEAAGIGLFRSRREEALTRLQDTERNLERVTDILSELEPQIHSLERQAKRAAEYEHVTGELKNLLRDWYGYHWHHAQQELVVFKERLFQQERRTNEARTAFETRDRALKDIQQQIRELRLQISEKHNHAAEVHKQIEKLTRENAILDERLSAAKVQIANRREESARLEEDLTLLREREKELADSLATLKKEETEAAEQKKKYSDELNVRVKEITAVREELRNKRDEQNKVESRLIRLKGQREDLEERTTGLQNSLSAMKPALDRLEQNARIFEKENEKFFTLQRQNEEKLSGLNEETERLEKEAAALEVRLREARSQKNTLEAEAAKLNARLEVLKDAEKKFSGMNRGSQFLAQSAGKGLLKGRLRSLQSLLDVPREYETAVTAALGEMLDAVLLDESEWLKAMELLSKGQNGRAVLLSEKAAEASGGNTNAPGTPLLSLIRVPEEIRPLVSRILGGVSVVDTREEAFEIMAELQPGQALVTPTGDLFRGNGSAASGYEGTHRSLSRTREIRELKESLDAAEAEALSASESLRKTESESAALSQQLKEKQAERSRLRGQTEELRKKISQITIEKEKQVQSIAYQRQRMKDAAEQVERNSAQSEELLRQSGELESVRDRMQRECRELQDKLNRIQVSELQDQVQHWNVSCAVLRKSVLEAETRIRENKADQDRNLEKSKSISARIDSGEKDVEDLEGRIRELLVRIEEENQRAEAVSGDTAPLEAGLKKAEDTLQADQANYQELQQQLVSSERLLGHAQMEVTRQDDRLEELKRRVEDDLGMVNFIYDDKIEGQKTLPLGEVVSELPKVEILSENLEEQVQRLKNHLRRMGAVNTEAVNEYRESSERYNFLKSQMADLRKAESDLHQVIAELNRMMEEAFLSTFDKVQAEFKQMFVRLFGGGSARLSLSDPSDVNSSGIEIEAKLPGHREQELSLLSGGERSLTSVALIFSLLRVSPTPFCVMDEVDAALDEANVGRFCELLKDLGKETQFLLITHNRNTVEASDVIYGITMASDSTSQVVSLRLDEVKADILK